MNKGIIVCVSKKYYPYFSDYLNSIQNYIEFTIYLYDESLITAKNKKEIQNYKVIIFVQYIPSCLTFTDENLIFVLNTEQLSQKKWLNDINSYQNIIDYSKGNIKLLKRDDIYYFPYGVNKNEIYNFNKQYDVCFVGNITNSNKRKSIISDLLSNGIKVNVIDNLYGEKRDQLLFKHKILLNIHFDENYKIYESFRCDRCIFNKMIVITEESLDDKENILKDKLITCKYNTLVDTTIEILKNYNQYYQKIFGNYEEFMKEYQDKIKKIYGL